MEFNFTKEQKENILKNINFVINIRDSEITEDECKSEDKIETSRSSFILQKDAASLSERCLCGCKYGREQSIYGANCPYCGRSSNKVLTSRKNIALGKKYGEANKDDYGRNGIDVDNIKSKIDGETCYFAQKHPTKENSIIVMKVIPSISYKENLTFDDIQFIVKEYIEIIPEIGIIGHKGKTDKSSTTGFDFFNINSKTTDKKFIWDRSNSLIDFLKDNEKFGDYTGFTDALYMQTKLSPGLFFQYYFVLYEKYPSIEKLIKIKMSYIIEQIIISCTLKSNKKEVLDKINSLKKLINPEAKSAKDVFSFPFWMVDFLNSKKASLREIIIWNDIFSYDNMGKEVFFKTLASKEYREFSSAYYSPVETLGVIVNILKYGGYDFKGIIKYVNKRYNINIFCDYLKLCELTGITPEKYPSQLEAAHNSVSSLFRAKANEIIDSNILKITNKYKKYIPKHSEYSIILPTCTEDFVQEGINQHNCVACYAKKVAESNGNCIVGFLRKLDNIDESFITFEIRNGSLTQVMYKNNRACGDVKILNYLSSFRDAISN